MSSNSRVACVRIPMFPIAAVARSRSRRASTQAVQQDLFAPEAAPVRALAGRAVADHAWLERATAVVEADVVRAATPPARRAGVRSGMRVAEARARCATLEILPWDPYAIRAAIEEVTTALLAASPQVEAVPGSPGLWWIGAAGFDPVGGEPALGAALSAIATAWHPKARVTIADTVVSAEAATWVTPAGQTEVTVAGVLRVASGGDAAFLAPLPLTLLPMDVDMREALWGLGVETVGALAALPYGEVEVRWGADGVAAWSLAHGIDARAPGMLRVDDPFASATDLPTGLGTMGALWPHVQRAVRRVVEAVAARGGVVAALAIELTVDDGRERVRRVVAPPHPSADTDAVEAQVRATLETWILPAPATAVLVRVTAWRPAAGTQLTFFESSQRTAGALATCFATLRAQFGSEVVRTPAASAAHWLDAAGAWRVVQPGVPAIPAVPRATEAEARGGDRLPASRRLWPTPVPVRVFHRDGRPAIIRWDSRRVAVRAAHGPERRAGAWWSDTPIDRTYWVCETDGPTYLLYAEESPGAGGCESTRGAVGPTSDQYHQDSRSLRPAAASWFLAGWYD